MTLTYIARLARVKVDLHAKDEGCRSNGSARRVVTDRRTDGQTDGRYQVHYLPRFAVDNEGNKIMYIVLTFTVLKK